jgi:HSP20 family molecular chaperone IbpA
MSLLNTLIPALSRSPATTSTEAAPAGPTIKPVYEVKENNDAYGLTVFLPGVSKENLEITAEEGQFRILGRRAWKHPENWTAVYRESTDAPFELVLAHDNLIDADKVVAELKDGILRVSLPKHEAVKPRKISVN